MVHFNIPEFQDCDQFLALISRKLGRLKKGGRPDFNAAAKYVSFLNFRRVLKNYFGSIF